MSGRNRSTDALVEELIGFCQTDSLAEDGLRAIFQRYNNHHVENYEFFLWVCHNELVTEGILRCLLEFFPDAASATQPPKSAASSAPTCCASLKPID